MKAISLHQPWASLIRDGKKTLETRRWPTRYRGDLLICASKNPKVDGLPMGVALCIVRVTDCRPMTRADEPAACCDLYDGAWAWELTDLRPLEPFPVRGKQGFFDVELPAPVAAPLSLFG